MTAASATFGDVCAFDQPVLTLRPIKSIVRATGVLAGTATLFVGAGAVATVCAAWIVSAALSTTNPTHATPAGTTFANGARTTALTMAERIPSANWNNSTSDQDLQASVARAKVLNAQLARLAPPAPAKPVEVATVPLPTPAPAQNTKIEVASLADSGTTPLTTGSVPPHAEQSRSEAVPLPLAYPGKREVLPEIAAPATAAPLPATPKLASLPPPQRGKAFSMPDVDHRTAVYDISARTVYMPSGERLEAHSGLGEKMDDPRYVHVRMRGATPPNVYKLTEREALFHGVRAIRLNPVDDSKMFGRDGILAHTYMLGPSGQSNGCVSFKDYDKFLRAFLNGEVDRMVVVTHMDGLPPAMVARNGGRGTSNLFAAAEPVDRAKE